MAETKHKDTEESINQDFRMRFSTVLDDIKYIKSRQWSVTYYCLLIFPAIMAFYKIIKLDPQIAVPCWQRVILFLIAIFIGVLGTIFQVDFQDRLYGYRKRLVKEVLPQLSGKLEESELRDTDKVKYVSRWNGFVKFTLPFILMLWIGVLIVFWYLFLV